MISPLLPTYSRIDLSFEEGEGAWLRGSDGRRYLDFGAGIAVCSLGYSHPHLVETFERYARKVWHVSNLFRIVEAERLADRLTRATFADTIFFTNSGAEAIECAIKMARRRQFACGRPERYRLITFEGAFHGRTLAAVAATGNPKYLEGLGPKVEGFDQAPFADVEAAEALIGPETAGILIEPVMGEGGVRVVPPATLRALRDLCDRHDLSLIFDEIQCGMGRVGRLFAYETAGVTPDILTSAKGIGGGFPLGACLATEKAAQGMTLGTHGTTFGGNPLATAIGNAVLDIVLEPEFLEGVDRVGRALKRRLMGLPEDHPGIVEEVRGVGLMLGLRLAPSIKTSDFAEAARREGLIVIPAGDNVVRLIPPLIIGDEEVEAGGRRLEAACRRLETRAEETLSS
jgi:acetylornithine/N-succinyldiaminopimelate aminotransferase